MVLMNDDELLKLLSPAMQRMFNGRKISETIAHFSTEATLEITTKTQQRIERTMSTPVEQLLFCACLLMKQLDDIVVKQGVPKGAVARWLLGVLMENWGIDPMQFAIDFGSIKAKFEQL